MNDELQSSKAAWRSRLLLWSFVIETSFVIWHSSFVISPAFHVSRITSHASRFTHHASRITHHVSRITFHVSRFNKTSSDAHSTHAPRCGTRRSSKCPGAD